MKKAKVRKPRDFIVDGAVAAYCKYSINGKRVVRVGMPCWSSSYLPVNPRRFTRWMIRATAWAEEGRR